MKTSCGIIILNNKREILLGHTTGQQCWDLPKGGIHPDEAPVDCAVRECYEETNLKFEPSHLQDLGVYDYIKTKNLHLFYIIVKSNIPLDLTKLTCHTYFTHKNGNMFPEMDDYKWVDVSELSEYCVPSMVGCLHSALEIIFPVICG